MHAVIHVRMYGNMNSIENIPVNNRIRKRMKVCFTVNLFSQKQILKVSSLLSFLGQKVFTGLISLVC